MTAAEAHPVRALAAALQQAVPAAEVRLRCQARPVPPAQWRTGSQEDGGTSILGFIARAIADGILLRPTADPGPVRPARLTSAERDAEARRRKAVVGFDVGLSLEVAGVGADAAEALLWRLIGFTSPLDDGVQAVEWRIRRGAASARPSASRTGSSPSSGRSPTPRSTARASTRVRPLGAPPPQIAAGGRLVLGSQPGRRPRDRRRRPRPPPRGLRVDWLGQEHAPAQPRGRARRTPIGVTVIDPHGDLTGDILARIPGVRRRPRPCAPARRQGPPARLQLPRAPLARRGAARHLRVRRAVRGPVAAVLRPEDAALSAPRAPDAARRAGARDDHRAHPRPHRRRVPRAAGPGD